MSHAMQGHPRWAGRSEEFWQNVVQWRRNWLPTPWENPMNSMKRQKVIKIGKNSSEKLTKRWLLTGRKVMTKLDTIWKAEISFCWQGPYGQSYGFSCSHVWMWELDHKEGWTSISGFFWILVLEKSLESPLDCKEIKPVNPKGNQVWVFFGGTTAEAPKLWPPDAKSQLIGIDPDFGKCWGQEQKGVTEDEMVR